MAAQAVFWATQQNFLFAQICGGLAIGSGASLALIHAENSAKNEITNKRLPSPPAPISSLRNTSKLDGPKGPN